MARALERKIRPHSPTAPIRSVSRMMVVLRGRVKRPRAGSLLCALAGCVAGADGAAALAASSPLALCVSRSPLSWRMQGPLSKGSMAFIGLFQGLLNGALPLFPPAAVPVSADYR